MRKTAKRAARRKTSLKEVLDRQLIALAEASSSACLTGIHIDERSDFDVGEPDLGYLCKVTHDLLDNIVRVLASLRSDLLGSEPLALATLIETQRQQLFRAQAVVESAVVCMRAYHKKHGEADLSPVFGKVNHACQAALAELDSASLGLPSPSMFRRNFF
jgi:hypothetical protein